MTPRKRSKGKTHLPENLYEQDGYYSWRDPRTGKRMGIGRDLNKARQEAIAANLHIATVAPPLSLVERLSGAVTTWGEWCDKFDAILAIRKMKPNTRRIMKSYSKRVRVLLSEDTPFRSVSVKMIAEALDGIVAQGQERTAQAIRSYLKDSFNSAIAQGWTTDNPAAVTRFVPVEVRRARLTLAILKQIYDAEQETWLKNAIALALVTAQRREDIALAKFKDVREGALWVDQGKTGAKVIIPLGLSLESFGINLAGVL